MEFEAEREIRNEPIRCFFDQRERREGKSRQSKGKFEFGDSLEEVVIEWKEKREKDEVRGKITQVEEVTCSNGRERERVFH